MYSNDIVTHQMSKFYILLKHRSLSFYNCSVLGIPLQKWDKDMELYSLVRCTLAYILRYIFQNGKSLLNYSSNILFTKAIDYNECFYAENKDEKCTFHMFSH